MMDLRAFISHLCSENPLVSVQLTGLWDNLRAVLACLGLRRPGICQGKLESALEWRM